MTSSMVVCFRQAFEDFTAFSLFGQMFRLRKTIFCDHLHWQIPHADELEIDRYDSPHARYVLIVEDGKLLASLRLAPTTAPYLGYMIKDCWPDIASNIQEGDDLWECTRLIFTPELSPRQQYNVSKQLVYATIDYCQKQDIQRLVGITKPRTLDSMLAKAGCKMERIAEKWIDGQRYAACVGYTNIDLEKIALTTSKMTAEDLLPVAA